MPLKSSRRSRPPHDRAGQEGRSRPGHDRQGRGHKSRGHHGEGDPNWIWGAHPVLAVLANPARKVERLVATRNAAPRLPAGVEAEIIDPEEIDRLLPAGAVHQGLAVKAAALEPLALEEACAPLDGRPVLVLDQVSDPQNVGAIFRSAAAFGARAVVMQDRRSPPATGALAKAAAGALELVPEARVVNIARAIEALGEMGYRTIGLAGEGGEAIEQAAAGAGAVALVLGAEGRGLRDLVAASCQHSARIPISPAMESLNVSVAAAVALYAVRPKS